jgi:hypothetical protein
VVRERLAEVAVQAEEPVAEACAPAAGAVADCAR